MRRWLAQKLCPEAFEAEEKWRYASLQIDDLEQWLSIDFPQIGEAVRWLKKSIRVHFMPLDEYHALSGAQLYREVSVSNIGHFREELRRSFPPTPADAVPAADAMRGEG